MLDWAELEPKLELELRAQDPENPDKGKPLRCGFDEEGCKIVQAPYEEEVELHVHNRSDTSSWRMKDIHKEKHHGVF